MISNVLSNCLGDHPLHPTGPGPFGLAAGLDVYDVKQRVGVRGQISCR